MIREAPGSWMIGVAVCVLAVVAALPAEARKREAIDPGALAPAELERLGAAALLSGDGAGAVYYLAELVSRQPRDGARQALLGLAYQLAAERDPQAMQLALAGYDLALRVEPGQFWPAALAGRAAFDGGDYEAALDHFARALLLRPTDERLVLALAASAYMTGDAGLASLAADRALALGGGFEAARLAVLAAAALGDGSLADQRLATLAVMHPEMEPAVHLRAAALLQTTAVDGWDAETSEPGVEPEWEVDDDPEGPMQIALDVAIILAQNTRRERTGLNLLDGLGLQYGFDRQSTRVVRRDDGVTVGRETQRILTTSISVPQLNYNLNLFNRGGQHYSVVARPHLTAYLGEESEFFIGRSLKVAVGGINLGSLEQIDIGVEMRVTPLDITPEGTRVRIETGRSFVTTDPAGNFNESLTTFRQRVAATAQIRFGETLLLSGLNETVEDRTFSKTPVLGDLPAIGTVFNERNSLQRQDSVLVLVTPASPTILAGRPWSRPAHVQRLTALWTQVIDPASDAGSTVERLQRNRMFTRMTRADVSMAFPPAREVAPEMIGQLLGTGGW